MYIFAWAVDIVYFNVDYTVKRLRNLTGRSNSKLSSLVDENKREICRGDQRMRPHPRGRCINHRRHIKSDHHETSQFLRLLRGALLLLTAFSCPKKCHPITTTSRILNGNKGIRGSISVGIYICR